MARRSSSKPTHRDLVKQAAEKALDRRTGWTVLVSGFLITAFLWWRNHDTRIGYAFAGFDDYYLLNTAFVLWVPLLIVLMGLRRDPKEFGMDVDNLNQGLKLALGAFLLFSPVLLIFASQPGPREYYLSTMGQSRAVQGVVWNYHSGVYGPVSHTGVIDWSRLAYHEVVMGFYMFGWEFFFRGYLLNGVRKIAPIWAAVLIQAVLFTAMHWSKPPAEVISSFPGAMVMALLALRTRSFLPCFVLHYLISAGFDGAVLYFQFRH